jgi:hypothetical protein
MLSVTLTKTAVLAIAALAGALLMSACERTADARDDPVKAVKDFLDDGIVDHDGYEACVFMTTRQQRAAARLGVGPHCRQAFDRAGLELGGETVDTVHKVEALANLSSVDGDRAWVRLSRRGETVEFRLVKATAREKEQFLAPDTEWRIARGGISVIPHARRVPDRAQRGPVPRRHAARSARTSRSARTATVTPVNTAPAASPNA